MSIAYRTAVLVMLSTFFLLPLAFGQQEGPNLTSEERAYLDSHRPVTFISQSNYPPFEFRNQTHNQDGMTIELAHWLETELDFRAEFTDTSFLQAQNAVLSNNADVLTSLFYSQKRDQDFDFTEVLFEVPASIFVSSERPDIVTLADLSGKRIAIQRGDYAKDFLEEKGVEFKHIPTLDFAEATDALIQGRADAIIGDEQIVLYYLFSHGLTDQVKKVGEPIYVGLNCMAVKDGNQVLLSILNKGIAFAKQRGVLQRINQKWIGTHFTDPEDYWYRYWPYLAALASLVLMVILWNVYLRRAVNLKTRALQESEKRFRDLYEGTLEREKRLDFALRAANDGLWDWNPQTGEVYYSPRWKAMLGYEEDDVASVYESWEKLLHPDDRSRVLQDVSKLLQNPDVELCYTVRMLAKDGNWKWIFSRGMVMETNAQGIPTRVVGTHQDITLQKQIEEELRKSQESYSLVVDNLKSVVFQTNVAGRWTFLNPAWEEITGFPVSASLGKLFLDYIHPEDRERNLTLFQPLIEGTKNCCRHEIRYLTREGLSCWVEVFVCLTLNEEGQVLGTSGTLTDITERKKTEADLKISEERFRRIFDELSIGMALCDEKGKFLKINQAFTEIIGYTNEEMSQLTFADITPVEFHDEEARLFKCLLDGSLTSYKIEKQCIHKDGYLFWSSVNANKLQGSEGSPTLFIGSIENIDQEKQLAMQVKQREETISLLLNSTAEAIYGLDSFGHCTFCNQSCLNILGYQSAEELLGRNMHDVIHHTTAEGLPHPFEECQIFKSFQHGEKIHIEMDYLWKVDGTSFPAELWSHPIQKNNAIIGAVVTFIDITKQKQTEEKRLKLEGQLHQSQKMEAIGTMAGGIAHDFNNLLAIISGNLDLSQLKQQAGKPIDENLENIRGASDRAINLVAQILAFSRQEQKELISVNLTTFVGESLKFLRPMIPTTVELMTEVPEDPVFINADTTKLQQVLINLCSNALHAMNEKGLLRISLSEGDLTSQEVSLPDGPQASRYAKLSVTDTGQGMDRKILDRIFDPFFTTKKLGVGTGMGLSVVHGIIEQHGGIIQVDSTPGQGSTFTLYFPITPGDKVTEEATVEEVLPTGTERILFIDDEPCIADSCGALLEGPLGYKVTVMTDSIEALDMFKEHPHDFDLVITDQTMPKMSGLELAKKLLSIRPELPIILCSGYGAHLTEDVVKDAGIRAYRTKPLLMKQLALVVREVLDERDNHS